MTTLEGRRWRLVSWRAADGSREAVPPDIEATALFEDGAVTGRGGCNGLRAPYELAGPRLAIGPVASTMMACAEPAMRVESGYHAGLARVAAMRVTEDSLELLDDKDDIVLAFAAAVTSRIALGSLVTGVTYRYPALLVKTVTTLDVLTGGRAMLGLGAAWFEREHRGLGVPWPSRRERFEQLEETLQIARRMFAGDATPYVGRHA